MRGAAVALLALAAACERAPVRRGEPAEPTYDLGALGAGTGQTELERRYGRAELRHADVPLGEGETAPGTVLFPGDPLRRVSIVWSDERRTGIARVVLAGDTSRWTVAGGVTLGTRLTALERVNRGPFTLAGFGWDYSGTVLDWQDGALARIPIAGRLLVRLAPTAAARATPDGERDARQLAGDSPYPSTHPAMRRLDPAVYEIVLDYPERP
jgi:hypothetical protein